MWRFLSILILFFGVLTPIPIFSTTNNDWRLVGELEVGEKVLNYHSVEIKDLHNFLVGDVGVVVHNNCKWILGLIKFDFVQVKRKMKHAKDFGFSDAFSISNKHVCIEKFKKHLESWVSNNAGKKYCTDVNFINQHKDAILVFEETTSRMVVTKENGEFISCWQMTGSTAYNLLNNIVINYTR